MVFLDLLGCPPHFQGMDAIDIAGGILLAFIPIMCAANALYLARIGLDGKATAYGLVAAIVGIPVFWSSVFG